MAGHADYGAEIERLTADNVKLRDRPGLNERPARPNLFSGGLWAWTARDRRGRRWEMTWYPMDPAAWLYPAGVTRFTGDGADLGTARAESARIAALISEEG